MSKYLRVSGRGNIELVSPVSPYCFKYVSTLSPKGTRNNNKSFYPMILYSAFSNVDEPTDADKGVSDNYKAIHWTPLNTRLLEKFYDVAPLSMQCNQSDGNRFPVSFCVDVYLLKSEIPLKISFLLCPNPLQKVFNERSRPLRNMLICRETGKEWEFQKFDSRCLRLTDPV